MRRSALKFLLAQQMPAVRSVCARVSTAKRQVVLFVLRMFYVVTLAVGILCSQWSQLLSQLTPAGHATTNNL